MPTLDVKIENVACHEALAMHSARLEALLERMLESDDAPEWIRDEYREEQERFGLDRAAVEGGRWERRRRLVYEGWSDCDGRPGGVVCRELVPPDAPLYRTIDERELRICASCRRIAVERLVRSGRRIDRNDPCPCQSGKKYKRCCR